MIRIRSWLWRLVLGWAALVTLATQPQSAAAQPAAAPGPASLCGTYAYQSYTVMRPDSGAAPTRIPGAGGTLTLRPDGGYDKRLRLRIGEGPPREFNQQGRFTTLGDSIFFHFEDKNGADTQRGGFRWRPETRQLTLVIAGYPPGNAGRYELSAAPDSAAALAPKPRLTPTPKPARRPRRPTARPLPPAGRPR